MDTPGNKGKTDVAGMVRQLMYDAAWLAHQQCCFLSILLTNNDEVHESAGKPDAPGAK